MALAAALRRIPAMAQHSKVWEMQYLECGSHPDQSKSMHNIQRTQSQKAHHSAYPTLPNHEQAPSLHNYSLCKINQMQPWVQVPIVAISQGRAITWSRDPAKATGAQVTGAQLCYLAQRE